MCGLKRYLIAKPLLNFPVLIQNVLGLQLLSEVVRKAGQTFAHANSEASGPLGIGLFYLAPSSQSSNPAHFQFTECASNHSESLDQEFAHQIWKVYCQPGDSDFFVGHSSKADLFPVARCVSDQAESPDKGFSGLRCKRAGPIG